MSSGPLGETSTATDDLDRPPWPEADTEGLAAGELRLFGSSISVELMPETKAPTAEMFIQDSDSLTTERSRIPEAERAVRRAFASAQDEIFEDGMENGLSRGLAWSVGRFGSAAIVEIASYLYADQANTEVMSEALKALSRIHQPSTLQHRRSLLETSLFHASGRVRDGALLGLAYLDDPRAIDAVRRALSEEVVPQLRDGLAQVLSQLEDTQRCHSF